MRKKQDTKPIELNVFKFDSGVNYRYPSTWKYGIKGFFRKIKFAWQRITKGYCDWDTWDLDKFYAGIIAGSLEDMAENLHSYPDIMEYEEWQKLLKTISRYFYAYLDTDNLLLSQDDQTFKQEIDMYKKSLDAYENIIRIRLNHVEFSSEKEREKEVKRQLDEYILREKRNPNLKKGLELFSKYYEHFWD